MKFNDNKLTFTLLTLLLLTSFIITESVENNTPHLEEHSVWEWDDEDPDKFHRF